MSAKVKSDIEIARAAKKRPILEIGQKLGIPAASLEPYGNDKAKVSADFIRSLTGGLMETGPRHCHKPDAGRRGKDTTTVGLGRSAEPDRQARRDSACASRHLGHASDEGPERPAAVTLSRADEDINLHFTGDSTPSPAGTIFVGDDRQPPLLGNTLDPIHVASSGGACGHERPGAPRD